MRLIDADRALEIVRDQGIAHPNAYHLTKYATLILREAPTIEAEPVRYGRWIHTDLAAHWHGKDECSECTYHEKDRSDLSHLNYCPNCGCKMQGENNALY